MSTQVDLLSNIMNKLDDMPLSFDITTDTELLPCLNDAMREMGITDLSSINVGSEKELYLELRSVWWALFRFRNTSSINFKFSSGNDGRAVDKTKITEMVDKIMNDLAGLYNQWNSTKNASSKSSGGIWTRSQRESDTLG